MSYSKFIFFNTETQFNSSKSKLPQGSIVFIKDTRRIYTHGSYFAGSDHNHTTLTGVTSIGFASNSSDSASITTTVSGTATTMDFNLSDDINNDYWRWRFSPSGGSTFSAMELRPDSKTTAKLILTGALETSGNITTTGTVTAAGAVIGSNIWNSFEKDLDIILSNNWVDTGIVLNNSTFPDGPGTYAVQVIIADINTCFKNELYSGMFSVTTLLCDSNEQDEIILHHSGHNSENQAIYLKTQNVINNNAKLQISSSKQLSSAIKVKIKMKKIL